MAEDNVGAAKTAGMSTEARKRVGNNISSEKGERDVDDKEIE